MQPTPGLQTMHEGSMGSGMSEKDATLLRMALQSLQPLQFLARTRTLKTHDERAMPDRLWLCGTGGTILEYRGPNTSN